MKVTLSEICLNLSSGPVVPAEQSPKCKPRALALPCPSTVPSLGIGGISLSQPSAI